MIVYGLTMPGKNLLYKCDVWFIERCFTQLVDGHIRCFKHRRDGFIENNFRDLMEHHIGSCFSCTFHECVELVGVVMETGVPLVR